ncbi:MAG: 4-(cytidine 5'-diphospho)-2-C-methyl-D-erythritol kinase [bacterium]
MISILARAKVNLFLHIGAKQANGYHPLSSVAIFPPIGDRLELSPAPEFKLTFSGPFAAEMRGIPTPENLIYKAAIAFASDRHRALGVHIHLQKNLPPAAGIGGGTADAAATLYALSKLWGLTLSEQEFLQYAFAIGADGPVCIMSHLYPNRPIEMQGIGEKVNALAPLSPYHLCLVNPMRSVSTLDVFERFDQEHKTATNLEYDRAGASVNDLVQATRNDLVKPACKVCPEITAVLEFMGSMPGCRQTRMSGSGATCFAIMDNTQRAQQLVEQAQQRGYWAEQAFIGVEVKGDKDGN